MNTLAHLSPDYIAALRERFWSRVHKTNECWEWMAGKTPKGYGHIGIKVAVGEKVLAVGTHRISWMLMHGAIPAGLFVCHKCDNPACVRPDHLFLGNHTENMHDMYTKQRGPDHKAYRPTQVRGERCHKAKLTEATVRQLRHQFRQGTPATTLATVFGIAECSVYKAVSGQTWRHVPD